MSYFVGTQIALTGEFRDRPGGVLVDPTTVTCKVKCLATGATEDVAVTRQSTGIYKAWYTPPVVSQYQYRFAGVGAVVVAGEGRFSAQSSF